MTNNFGFDPAIPLASRESGAPPARSSGIHLLFVCSRNQWRSPTGESIYRRHPGVQVRSAGTAASARRRLGAEDLLWADLIVVMESSHRKRILSDYGNLGIGAKIHVANIPDEYQAMDAELIEMLQLFVDPLLARWHQSPRNLHRILLAVLLPLAACLADNSTVRPSLKQVHYLESMHYNEMNRYGSLVEIGYVESSGMVTKVELVGKTGFIATTCDPALRRCESINEKQKFFVDKARMQAILKKYSRPVALVSGKPVQVTGTLFSTDFGNYQEGDAHMYVLYPTQPYTWTNQVMGPNKPLRVSAITFEPDTSEAELFSGPQQKPVTISGVFRAVPLTPTRQILVLERPKLVP